MDETIQKAIGKLEKLVEDKSEALNTVNIAVNLLN